METGIFGAGCFWKPDVEFEKLKGVKKTEVGYCGGNNSNTTYEKVCTGTTDHAEVVKVHYDDIGSQYRSEIFYTKEEQKEIAEKVIKEANNKFKEKIVTKISKEFNYCKAEDYHQKYLKKKGLL